MLNSKKVAMILCAFALVLTGASVFATVLLSSIVVPGSLFFWIYLSLILALLVIAAVAGSIQIVRSLVEKPVKRLQRGLNKLAEKEFSFRFDEGEDEPEDSLISSFNEMADMLEASINAQQKNKDYLEGILESTADIIFTVNPSGLILSMNSGAEKALGYDRMELVGKPMAGVYADPEDRTEALERLKDSGVLTNYETRFVAKDGTQKTVLLTISELKNPSGETIGTIGISKDITELNQLQGQLIHSQRLAAVGEVFTGLQHSLKNMLNTCVGGSYMVNLGMSKGKQAYLEEGWDIVQEGLSKMTNLSKDMLRYAKEWKPRQEQVDLSETLKDIDRIVKKSAEEQEVLFTLKLREELPLVICDTRMIHSAVMDLVTNAIEACQWKEYAEGEQAAVSLDAYPNHEGKHLIVEVTDNGTGMPEEVKEMIFNPFFTTKSKAGTGLGLAITKRMIDTHNGLFEIDSTPGEGTSFRIVLPLHGTNQNKENTNG